MVKPKNSFEKVHTLTRRKKAQQLQLWFVRAVGPWSKCVGLPHENLREDRALDVRFASESRHVHCTSPCLLWANSGHQLGLESDASRTLYAVMGRRMPLSANSPTASTVTPFSTACRTRG